MLPSRLRRRFSRRLPGQRKKAAGESESEWSDSDEADDEEEEEEDGNTGGRGGKKGGRFSASSLQKDDAFQKVLKDMMERRQQAEPGVLQEVRSWPPRVILARYLAWDCLALVA